MPTPAIQAIIQGAPIRVEMKAPQGPGGKSAYQIAVENGFAGTEAQWLASLVGPNTVTSATTTNFTSGNVLFANSGFVGSLSRSGIDTRTSFPNNDVTNATTTGTPSQLLRLNSAGNTVANIFIALEGIEIGEEGGDAGFIRILNNNGDVVTINNANSSNAEISLPTESGTLALTTDIVDSVTSATTSDGTANLSISNVTTATATVSSLLTANHIHGNIAGTLYTHVRTGEAVSKGDPVYVSGFHNGTGQAIVMRADASDAGKMPAIGVMDAAYAQNISSANCVIAGTITSVDTDAFSINSPVYVGDGGGFSETIGTIPQQVGIVERSNTNNGAFVVTNNKVISSADISDFATAVEAIAPNAVTSATTSDGTASLDISNLTLSQAITSGLQTKMVFTAEPTAAGDGQQIIWQWYNGGSPITTAAISSEATGSTSDKLIFKTTAGGSLSASLDLTNTLATFSGSISSLGESYRTSSTFTYASGVAATHRTALGLDTLFDGKANLVGGNTFTGSQSIDGTVTTSDKVTIDSANAVTNPKLLIMATTAQGVADGVPLVIKGSGVNRLASINLRSTGGSGELYDAWVSGKVGGGIQVNNSFTVSGGNSGPITGSTLFIVQSTGNVGVGVASPNAAAILDVTSTTKGFLPPRMTSTQRNAIATPPAGLVIYNTTTNNLNSYSGSAWVELVDSADLGTNVANFLTSPTSDNLASALTDENGTGGGFVRAEGATLTTPTLVGTPVFNATAYTYGTGAATAHKAALELFTLLTVMESDIGTFVANGGTAVGGSDGDSLNLTTATANIRPNVYRFRNWNRNPGNSGAANVVMPVSLASAGNIIHSGSGANGASFRCGIGMANGTSAVAADANATTGRGFGWRIAWNNATSKLEFNLWAHNGTTYVEGSGIDTGLGAVNLDGFFNVIVRLDAAGVVTAHTWFGNNSAASVPSLTPTATLAGGPTSGAFANQGTPLWLAATHSTVAPSAGQSIIAKIINRKLIIG